MKTLSASEQAEHSVHHASLPFEMRKDTSFWVQEVCGEMQTSAGPFLPCHPAPMLPQGPSYLQAISTHEFPIWFSHDVLYIIARATFQRKVLHRNKNSNCCAATHAARDQRQGQLDLKCAQLMPPNHSLACGIMCCECSDGMRGSAPPSLPSSWHTVDTALAKCRAALRGTHPEVGMPGMSI